MNYKKLIESIDKNRTMITEKDMTLTYGEFLDLVNAKEKELKSSGAANSRALYLVQESTVIDELVTWIACQNLDIVPAILPPDIKKESIDINIAVPEEACMAVLTSGTTGNPKVLFRSFHSWADFFCVQDEIFHINKDTVLFTSGTLSFTGNLNLYMDLFALGASVIAVRDFHPKTWREAIVKNGANYIYLIPAKMKALVKAIKEPIDSVEYLVTGSQSFGKEDIALTKKAFPNIKVCLYYGASEANYMTYVWDSEMGDDARLIGKAFPKMDLRLIDGVFYTNNTYGVMGITNPYCTNDEGFQDEAGNFYFLGRVDDRLNVNGRKCSGYKISEAMKHVFGLDALAAVQKEAERESLVVYYEGNELTLPVTELRKLLREALADYELPKKFIKVDCLPRTANGKIKAVKNFKA
ncbi:MAG: AMP-binding protein [Phascolarctobacterium sp.]|nr:AMP-binding protein [Phascolarctobacterium sp.]